MAVLDVFILPADDSVQLSGQCINFGHPQGVLNMTMIFSGKYRRPFNFGGTIGATGGVSTINGQAQSAPVPFQVWG